MAAEPVGQFFFGQFACGKREDNIDRILCVIMDGEAIEPKEHSGKHPRSALVPIAKRMVARDSIGIGRGQFRDIIFAIVPSVERTGERRVQHPFVTNAGKAAVLGKLAVMNSQRNI